MTSRCSYRLERAGKVALEVQRVGQVLERLPLKLAIAHPARDLQGPLVDRLRGGELLRAHQIGSSPRQGVRERDGDQRRFRREQPLTRLAARRLEERCREIVDRGRFAQQLPGAVLLDEIRLIATGRRVVEPAPWAGVVVRSRMAVTRTRVPSGVTTTRRTVMSE